MLYHRTDFSFSTEATKWILDRYHDRFLKNFDHDLDAEQYSGSSQLEWHASPVGQELLSFLKQYDLDTSYYGICAFVSNSNKPFIGNPHVDARFDQYGIPTEIKSRFNVLVQGNPKDKMSWWPTCTYWDKRLQPKSFKLNGQTFRHVAVPGNDPQSRWTWLGEPNISEGSILTPSAFVRTNCAHTVTVSPGPRIVVTVALDKELHEIIGP